MGVRRRPAAAVIALGAALSVIALAGACSSFSPADAPSPESGTDEASSADAALDAAPDVAALETGVDAAPHFCAPYAASADSLCADFDEGEVANYGLGVPAGVPPRVDLTNAVSPPGSMHVEQANADLSYVGFVGPQLLDPALSPKRRLAFDLFVPGFVLPMGGAGPYVAGLQLGDVCKLDIEQFDSYGRLVVELPGQTQPATVDLVTLAASATWKHVEIQVEDSSTGFSVTVLVDGKAATFKTSAAIACAPAQPTTPVKVTGYVGIGRVGAGKSASYDNVLFGTL